MYIDSAPDSMVFPFRVCIQTRTFVSCLMCVVRRKRNLCERVCLCGCVWVSVWERNSSYSSKIKGWKHISHADKIENWWMSASFVKISRKPKRSATPCTIHIIICTFLAKRNLDCGVFAELAARQPVFPPNRNALELTSLYYVSHIGLFYLKYFSNASNFKSKNQR